LPAADRVRRGRTGHHAHPGPGARGGGAGGERGPGRAGMVGWRAMRPPTFALGSRTLGEGQPCFVLAEGASAHGGSADRALKMLEAAFKMGADGIKFQLFRADLLVVRRHPGRKDFDQIELTEKEWRKVLRAARAYGLTLLVEPFDAPSLRLAEEEGADG